MTDNIFASKERYSGNTVSGNASERQKGMEHIQSSLSTDVGRDGVVLKICLPGSYNISLT